MARRWKYLLGPIRSAVAANTEPSWSTMTRTHTLICPLMVRRALRGTSGITSCGADDEVARPLRLCFRGNIVGLGSATSAIAGAAAPGICDSELSVGGDGAG